MGEQNADLHLCPCSRLCSHLRSPSFASPFVSARASVPVSICTCSRLRSRLRSPPLAPPLAPPFPSPFAATPSTRSFLFLLSHLHLRSHHNHDLQLPPSSPMVLCFNALKANTNSLKLEEEQSEKTFLKQ